MMRVLPPPEGRISIISPLRMDDFFDHDAGIFFIDIDQHFFDRLQLFAGVGIFLNSTRGRETESSKPSRRMVSISTPSCNSPRPPTSKASLPSVSLTRIATLVSASRDQTFADHARGDFGAFLAGERRIIDRDGDRHGRRIDRGRRRWARVSASSPIVSATEVFSSPAMQMISPASASSTGTRLMP